MACAGVTICVANATCVIEGAGFTCLCKDGFRGDGYKKCTPTATAVLQEDFILIIVFIVLLFVGLLVILIYFLCRRRMIDKSAEEPLVTLEDQYDMKWQIALSGNDKDVPPPYNDVAFEEKVPPAEMMTSFYTAPIEVPIVEDDRVPVEADEEEFNDEVDDVTEFDNPAYDTVEIKEEADVERAVIHEVYVPPDTTHHIETEETQEEADAEPPAVEEEEEDIGIDNTAVVLEEEEERGEVEEEAKPADIEPIKITFEEHEDAPNTITATVTTPDANLTINLNINVPGMTTPPDTTEEAAEEV